MLLGSFSWRALRVRLAAWSAVFVLLLGGGLGGAAYALLRRSLDEEVHTFAFHEAQELAILASEVSSVEELQRRVAAAPGLFPEPGVYGLTVYDSAGEPVLQLGEQPALASWDLDLDALHAGDVRYRLEDLLPDPALRCALRVGEPGGVSWVVASAVDPRRSDESLLRFSGWYALGLTIALLVTFFGAFGLLSAALRPMLRMVQEARALASHEGPKGRLSEPRSYAELEELAAFLNSTLERHEQNATRQARFSAHAGHELRTPLARVRAEAELALQTPDAVAKDEALGTILEEVDLLRRLIDGLLELARGEEQDLRQGPLTSMLEVVNGIAPDAAILAEQVGLSFETSIAPEQVYVHGNALLLTRTVWNLLENACKYAPPGAKLRLGLEVDAAQCRVTVADTGDGLVGQDLEAIFLPFNRGRPSAVLKSGLGLGLALSRAIARRHGGELRATREAGETRFTLSLPVGSPPSRLPDEPAPAEVPCP